MAWASALVLTLVITGGMAGSGAAGPAVPPALVERASAEGAVRVIVGFRLPPGVAPDAQAIAAARETVLRQVAGTRHRVVRAYETIPFVALEASPETLRALAASPEVSSVQEDALARPQ
jgi:hypothetical protein